MGLFQLLPPVSCLYPCGFTTPCATDMLHKVYPGPVYQYQAQAGRTMQVKLSNARVLIDTGGHSQLPDPDYHTKENILCSCLTYQLCQGTTCTKIEKETIINSDSSLKLELPPQYSYKNSRHQLLKQPLCNPTFLSAFSGVECKVEERQGSDQCHQDCPAYRPYHTACLLPLLPLLPLLSRLLTVQTGLAPCLVWPYIKWYSTQPRLSLNGKNANKYLCYISFSTHANDRALGRPQTV